MRLAAERGNPPPGPPAGEEAVHTRGRGWKAWLPYLFFALSLFALAGMVFGVTALADDGWSWSDAIELALMAVLVLGVITQSRAMLRSTPPGRWLSRTVVRRTPAPTAPSLVPAYTLDAVSAEYLTARQPAAAPGVRRAAVVRRTGGRAFERVAVIGVVVLAVLSFAGMLFVLGYILYLEGIGDSAVWLTAPFTGLTGFASFQVVKSAGKNGFRGRPWNLVTRAFRDSVHLWGSGSLISKVALTTTATASVAGAAVAPAVIGPSIPVDLFVVDASTNAFYRIDLDTLTGYNVNPDTVQSTPLGLTTTTAPLQLPDGKKLPAGSLLTVLELPNGDVQAVVAFRPGSRQPIQVGRIQPAIPGAQFAGGKGQIVAVQPDGTFWNIDPGTGAAARVGQLTIPVGPIAYDAGARVLLMLSEGKLARIDPATRSVVGTSPQVAPAGFEACGIARGPGDRVFIAEEGTGKLYVLRMNARTFREIPITGEAPGAGCLLTVARRK